MKKSCATFLSLSLFLVFSAAEPAFAGLEGDVYRVSYVCRDLKGNERWQATAEIRNKEGDIYTITERLEGFYYGFAGRISWEAETEFERTKETVRPLAMIKRVFDQSGKMIAVQKQDFNYTDKVVTCANDNLIKNTSVTKEFTFKKDIINRLLQGLYVQKFIENGLTRREIQFISSEPALYDLELKIVGTEEIEIDGRKRKAYKLCFDPMLGFFNFVKTFLPKAYVWHSAEPIFELLKYEGVESKISSPEVVIITSDKDAQNFKTP